MLLILPGYWRHSRTHHCHACVKGDRRTFANEASLVSPSQFNMSSTPESVGAKKLAALRVVDLKQELEKRGLEKTGVKAALIDRLKKVNAINSIFKWYNSPRLPIHVPRRKGC